MADDSKITFYSDIFPSPIAPDAVKKTKAYGKAVGEAIQNRSLTATPVTTQNAISYSKKTGILPTASKTQVFMLTF